MMVLACPALQAGKVAEDSETLQNCFSNESHQAGMWQTTPVHPATL